MINKIKELIDTEITSLEKIDSSFISLMEEKFGYKLINIIEKDKVVLTPFGKKVFQYMKDSLNIINKEI
ncbi:MAG: hypothetical protein LBU35_01965, partial [Holosporales bacterium]|nr:hypothetical protein [Holosporales bacterium]